jgi:hypothetical protein
MARTRIQPSHAVVSAEPLECAENSIRPDAGRAAGACSPNSLPPRQSCSVSFVATANFGGIVNGEQFKGAGALSGEPSGHGFSFVRAAFPTRGLRVAVIGIATPSRGAAECVVVRRDLATQGAAQRQLQARPVHR